MNSTPENASPLQGAEYVAARCRLYGGRQICPDADDSCRTECVPAAEYVSLVQVGWMPSPELAEELGLHPLHDEWLSSVEMCEDQGGILPELVGRLIPIYRIAQNDGENDDSCGEDFYEEATGGRVWCSLPVGHGGAHAAHNDGVDDAQ